MRRFATTAVLLLLCMVPHCAAAELEPASQVHAVQDALHGEAEMLMRDQSPDQPTDFLQHLTWMLRRTVQEHGIRVSENIKVGLRALVVIGLCQLMTLSESPYSRKIAAMTGALGIMACCGPVLMRGMEMTEKSMDEMSSLSKVLMPIAASTAMSSGGTASAASAYSLTVLFTNLLCRFSEGFAFPILFGCLACTMVDAAMEQSRMLRLRQFAIMMANKCLRLLVYFFTGLLTITGVITGNQDAAALKALKFSISFSVPVVGGIISDAAETVFSGAVFLKNTVGTFGMLAMIAISVVPFFCLALDYLLLKGIGALGGVMESSATELLEMLAGCIGYFMAVIGCFVYLHLLACVSLIRMVQV